MNIENIEWIYREFRRSQADYNNRGYRMPKDFEKHFNERMNEFNKKALIKITGWFITKWGNIDPYKYFTCGFDLYKGFTYKYFFKDRILQLYIQKDKNLKREVKITKEGMVKSAKFVKKWMSDNNATLRDYIRMRNGEQRVAIDHYLKNKIDASFFVYLMRKGMILTDQDRSYVPYIQERFRKINFGLNDIEDFIKKLEEKLI